VKFSEAKIKGLVAAVVAAVVAAAVVAAAAVLELREDLTSDWFGLVWFALPSVFGIL
jgi:hypothetical protein